MKHIQYYMNLSTQCSSCVYHCLEICMLKDTGVVILCWNCEAHESLCTAYVQLTMDVIRW